jgi:uroporphyrin-III C-methyltransferase/precorrin-2 dehydrogenase/sirohydrochlorin ferrochelatase
VLTRLLKEQVELLIPKAYSELARFVGMYRDTMKAIIPNTKKRVLFWESLVQGPIASAIFSGKADSAKKLMESTLSSPDFLANSVLPPQGVVYLIGAGPGDAELLTLKAFRLLKQADIVLYDRLVSDDVMALIKPEAELLYVGKRRENHSVPQGGINQLLVEHARQGKCVVRLKGGDPFIFGRGGEEIETLMDEKIPFQVVPGITAASGCSAYSGIPLTHRDYAHSVQFVTGQLKNGSVDLDWNELIAPKKTLVFYMGLKNLPIICQSLIEYGMKATMPVALIEKGSTPEQRVLVSTLATLPDELEKQTIASPSLFIIGEVVRLSEKLDWFEGADMKGLVTRSLM